MLFAKHIELETLNSRLLAELFDASRLDDGHLIRVLDLGPASAPTFSYLSRFNCRLRVIDIRDRLVQIDTLLKEDPEIDPAELEHRLEAAFGFKGDESFDVCLAWDFLNYLNVALLPMFARILLPRLSDKGKIHGFAVLNKSTPLTQQNYGVVDLELLSVTRQKNVTLPYRHSQSAIKDYLKGIAVSQSILRADGRLEMILKRI